MSISEVLPNPAGKDTDGEWIEIFNNSDLAVSLSGWRMQDASGKTFTFSGVVLPPQAYRVFAYRDTKLALNNQGDRLELFDASGTSVDVFTYQGTAQEAWSAARGNNGVVAFTSTPTPGLPNSVEADGGLFSELIQTPPQFEAHPPLFSAPQFFHAHVLLVALGVAVCCAWVSTMIVSRYRRHEDV